MFSSQTSVKLFKILAVVEAFTWVLLLIGMFLKYVTDTTAQGVQIAGPIHGTAFLLYAVSVLNLIPLMKWNWKIAIIGLFAAVPPFGTLIFERWAENNGHLREGSLTKLA